MKLPDQPIHHAKKSHYTPKWLVALCVVSLVFSLFSSAFTALVLLNGPALIGSYVEAHKEDLKGDKGDTGDRGPQGYTGAAGANGRNGSNSYAPTYCSTYSSPYSSYANTSCY